MSTRIIVFENEPDHLKDCLECLELHGFNDVHAFEDTEDVVKRVRELYDRPSIILTDYWILPDSPHIYLPQLRMANIQVPVVVMSSRMRFENLSDLHVSAEIAAWFSKGIDVDALVGRIAIVLAQLAPKAKIAYENYESECDARFFVGKLDDERRAWVVELLSFTPPSALYAGQGKAFQDRVYEVNKGIKAFIKAGPDPVTRYNSLLKVSKEST